jgi:hypothetical protein
MELKTIRQLWLKMGFPKKKPKDSKDTKKTSQYLAATL